MFIVIVKLKLIRGNVGLRDCNLQNYQILSYLSNKINIGA